MKDPKPCNALLQVGKSQYRCEHLPHSADRMHRGRKLRATDGKPTGEPIIWREGDQERHEALKHLETALAGGS